MGRCALSEKKDPVALAIRAWIELVAKNRDESPLTIDDALVRKLWQETRACLPILCQDFQRTSFVAIQGVELAGMVVRDGGRKPLKKDTMLLAKRIVAECGVAAPLPDSSKGNGKARQG